MKTKNSFNTFFLLIIIFQISNAQDLYKGLNLNDEDLKKITEKAFLIAENREDTIYIKRDPLSYNLMSNTKSKDTMLSTQHISFVPGEILYKKLIDNYYHVWLVREDYGIVRISYIQYTRGKVVEVILYKNREEEWELLKKKVSLIGNIRLRDFLHKLITIEKKQRHKK